MNTRYNTRYKIVDVVRLNASTTTSIQMPLLFEVRFEVRGFRAQSFCRLNRRTYTHCSNGTVPFRDTGASCVEYLET